MANIHINERVKLQRIDLRTTSQIKSRLVHAAELAGVSVSSFLIEAASEKAKNLIREQEILKLSDTERDKFLILLTRKAKPKPKLKKAMQKYLSKTKNK